MQYNRHKNRQFAIQILYTVEQNSTSLASAVEQVFSGKFEKSDEAIAFANYTMLKLEEIDNLIETHLTNYHLSRLNSVDRAILRLATAEMLENKTPDGIIINEALELTREFSDTGDNKAVRFNNSVLDAIKTDLRK
ncbi:MAG: transcription antitermination factor NusB [Acholeplasmatales bacterium]|nr:transcription antitermination factor NusB [Acholeplasmatales bacterium]